MSLAQPQTAVPIPALTNLQRELLGLFALDLSDDDLREVRRLLGRHFASKAADTFEAFADAEGLSPEDSDRWAFEHRSRSAPEARAP